MKTVMALLLILVRLGAFTQGPAIRTAGVDHVGIKLADLAQAE